MGASFLIYTKHPQLSYQHDSPSRWRDWHRDCEWNVDSATRKNNKEIPMNGPLLKIVVVFWVGIVIACGSKHQVQYRTERPGPVPETSWSRPMMQRPINPPADTLTARDLFGDVAEDLDWSVDYKE
jgi:hypothetical protein